MTDTRPTTQAALLRSLIAKGDIVAAPGAPDSLSARLVERAGFPAIYMTGFGATASRLGMPDIGLLSQTEMTEHARNMVRAVNIPIIADADTGYGGPNNIYRTVQEYLQAGVAAIHLEDQEAPKRCGQRAGVRLIDAEANARRLKGAVAARGNQDMLIIGRTDAMPAAGPEEAIRRAKMYQDAGVDLVFVDGIKTIAEIEAVAKAVEGPKVVSIVDGNETVKLDRATLQEMGFSVVFYAVTLLFTASKAMENALVRLRDDGTPANVGDQHNYSQFTDIVNQDFFNRFDDQYGARS
ncbi:isocitrate lyase/PEP mutase family protein [Vreelandella titanicae]|uniref:isocitrate lyase/PEP mutase family protein n=1 Tax=Halomonadaceae TaxID=28256 RepID=UPI00059AE42E|nr:isocitrate lyase/PEP mutase family protein [Halomonas sp. KHS3]KIN17006.1 2,3-dimethylmalate lyase [Halomonas sp. KHS3]